MQTENYKEGQIIFSQGEVTEQLYVIKQGRVAIYRNYNREGQRLLTELETGKSFAESALVFDRPRTVTAVAAENAVLEAYSREDFQLLQEKYPHIALDIITELSERLRRTTDRLMEACRTISESINEKELSKNNGLLARLKKFAAVYDEACKEEYGTDIAENTAKAVSAYNNFGTQITKK